MTVKFDNVFKKMAIVNFTYENQNTLIQQSPTLTHIWA